MWDKQWKDEMDDETRDKWTKKLLELGVAEDKVDDRLIHLSKKISHKLSYLRLVLDEKGIEEPKAKEIVEKLTAKALEKDLAKIKEWHSQHHDK